MKWLMLVPMTFLLVACEKQGPLERAGEEIDETADDIAAGGEKAANKIDDAIDEVRKDVEDEVEQAGAIAETQERQDSMDPKKIIAIVPMGGGLPGLAYGGFTYTEDTHEANIGSLSLSIDDKRRVNVPVLAGVGMLLAGGLLFANGVKRG